MQKQDTISEWGTFLASIRHDEANAELAKRTEKWMNSKRFNFTKRHYTAQDVANLMSSIDIVTPSHYLTQKLYKLLRENFDKKEALPTYGALDNIQMINSTKYLPAIYVSGW